MGDTQPVECLACEAIDGRSPEIAAQVCKQCKAKAKK